MPLLLGFVLVSLFIWLSENIGTYTKTWLYPSQQLGWSMVSLGKLGSWFLLLIISYTLVSLINSLTGGGSGSAPWLAPTAPGTRGIRAPD